MTELIGYLGDMFSTSEFSGPFGVFWFIFSSGGWIIVVIFLMLGLWALFRDFMNGKYSATLKYVLLSIDVPVENEQSLKAVEQTFAQIAGAHASLSFKDKYWTNKSQDAFSFEIVSIGGHIQFLVRCLCHHQDMIESTIYAQYPDAEIMEVEDYVDDVPNAEDLPHEDFDLWGTEITLAKDEYLPIRTYFDFEHQMTQIFADPLAAMLEIMGKIKPGEQIWIQFVIQHPETPNWDTSKAEAFIAKQLGKKIKQKETNMGKLIDVPIKTLSYISQEALGVGEDFLTGGAEEEKSKDMMGAFSLSPGDLEALKAVQRKASKLAFHTKIRFLYMGKKDVFNKSRAGAVFGTFKQFNTQDQNAFRPYMKSMTGALYFRVKQRVLKKKKQLLSAYKSRSTWSGSGTGKIMNIEELASVWHFPLFTVTGPLVKRSEAKKAGAPGNLEFADEVAEAEEKKKTNVSNKREKDISRPSDAPKVTSVADQIKGVRRSNKNVKIIKEEMITAESKKPSQGGEAPPNLPI